MRLGAAFHDVAGIDVHLQSVQDLQIDARVSGTAFQYTLEDADPKELAVWSRRMQDELSRTQEVANVASDAKPDGLGAVLVIDRDTAVASASRRRRSTTRSTTRSASAKSRSSSRSSTRIA